MLGIAKADHKWSFTYNVCVSVCFESHVVRYEVYGQIKLVGPALPRGAQRSWWGWWSAVLLSTGRRDKRCEELNWEFSCGLRRTQALRRERSCGWKDPGERVRSRKQPVPGERSWSLWGLVEAEGEVRPGWQELKWDQTVQGFLGCAEHWAVSPSLGEARWPVLMRKWPCEEISVGSCGWSRPGQSATCSGRCEGR